MQSFFWKALSEVYTVPHKREMLREWVSTVRHIPAAHQREKRRPARDNSKRRELEGGKKIRLASHDFLVSMKRKTKMTK